MFKSKEFGAVAIVLVLMLLLTSLPYSLSAATPSEELWSTDRLMEALLELDDYYQPLIGTETMRLEEIEHLDDTRSLSACKEKVADLEHEWETARTQLIESAGWKKQETDDAYSPTSQPSELSHDITTYYPPGGSGQPILVTVNYRWESDADSIKGPSDLLAVTISNRHDGWSFNWVAVTAYDNAGNTKGRCTSNGLGDIQDEYGNVSFEGPQDGSDGTGMYYYIDEGSNAKDARRVLISYLVNLGSGPCKAQCEYVHMYNQWQFQGYSVDTEGLIQSVYGFNPVYWQRRTAYRYLGT